MESTRNQGKVIRVRNRFHSICPYFAMFPETFVEKWIGKLTKPGDTVLDPFCGRGTTVFQALLMDRNAIGCDINPVAYCITSAKSNAPSVSALRRRITLLEQAFVATDWERERRKLPRFFRKAYRTNTLRQILYARSLLNWKRSDVDCMIAALILGALHGESEKSSSYLSNQMPRTVSTKPEYSIRYWEKNGMIAPRRDLFELLRNRVSFRYVSEPPVRKGTVVNTGIRRLSEEKKAIGKGIRFVVTSPPYLDTTNFEEDQWLRLWFLGGKPRPTYNTLTDDNRHVSPERYWEFIGDMWKSLGSILGKDSHIVIRLGGKNLKRKMIVEELLKASKKADRKIALVECSTSRIKNRQTTVLQPKSKGCVIEVDCHFSMQ